MAFDLQEGSRPLGPVVGIEAFHKGGYALQQGVDLAGERGEFGCGGGVHGGSLADLRTVVPAVENSPVRTGGYR